MGGTQITPINYAVAAQIKINSAISETGYTVKYNNAKTGTFKGTSSNNIVTVTNIPEGMKVSTVASSSNLSIHDTDGGYAAISYHFDKWISNDNNFGTMTLNNASNSSTTVNVNVGISDTFTALLTNNVLYVFYDR